MIEVKYGDNTAKRYSMTNFKFSVKRIRPLLHNIRRKKLNEVMSYLNTDFRPSSKRIANFLLSTVHGNRDSLKSYTLFTAYATTGYKKQGIIRGSRGNFSRQKSRTSHLFFVIGSE